MSWQDYAVVGTIFGIPIGAAAASVLLKPPAVVPVIKGRIVSASYGMTPTVRTNIYAEPIAIERGQSLRSTIEWQNTGTEDHAFDLISLIGDYNPGTGEYVIEYGLGKDDLQSSPSQIQTHEIDFVIPPEAKGGLRDGRIILCDYGPAPFKIYNEIYIQGVINVSPIAGAIKSVNYSKL